MQILDVFSWLPQKEIDIDELKTIFLKSLEGIKDDDYEVVFEIHDNVEVNIIEAANELMSDKKSVAYIKREVCGELTVCSKIYNAY